MSVLVLRHQATLATNTRRRNASAVESLDELGISLSIYFLPRARCRIRDFIWGDTHNRTVLVMELADLPADATLHVCAIPW